MLLIAIRSLAWACMNRGDVERGRALHEENLQRARALGNARLEAITLGALSTSYVEESRLDVALPMLLESHRLHEQLDDPVQTGFDLFRFAYLLTEAGEADAAAVVLAASDARLAEAGIDLRTWDPVAVGNTLARLRGRLGDEAFEEAWQRGRELTPERAFAVGLGAAGA
jgi:hypothetical protein